ncbi:MAG: ATP-binding protein [Polyangiaceae bacterium]
MSSIASEHHVDTPAAARARLLSQLRTLVFMTAPGVAIILLVQTYLYGLSPTLGALLALQIVAPICVWIPRWRTHHGTAIILFLYGLASTLFSSATFGPTMGVGMVLAVSGVWAGVMFGRRGVWMTAGLILAGTFAVNASMANGWVPRPDGRFLDVRVSINWVRIAGMTVIGLFAAAWLVTKLVKEYERSVKSAERALTAEKEERALDEGLFRELQQSKRLEMLYRLAGGAGHEITNALAVILCNAEILRKSGVKAHSELASEVLEAARGATRTSRQLMALGHREPSVAGVVEPKELASRLGRLLKRVLPDTIRLEVSVKTDRLLSMNAEALERVLLNLVLNARDAMPNGGRLTLEISALDESGPRRNGTAIEVVDSGTGMTEETRARIFEPFFTTKPAGQGTGMGLSVALGLINSAGGVMTVKTQLGVGSTIRIELPAPKPQAERPDPNATATPQLSPNPQTILLVEDEARVRAVMRRILKRAGHEVIEAADGAEALAAIEQSPDLGLLITDGILPGTSSQAVVDAFRERFPSSPVVVCSGYSEELLIEQGLVLDRCARLPKPFTPQELLDVVQAARTIH